MNISINKSIEARGEVSIGTIFCRIIKSILQFRADNQHLSSVLSATSKRHSRDANNVTTRMSLTRKTNATNPDIHYSKMPLHLQLA